MAYTVYAYFNQEAVQGVFNAIVGIVGDGSSGGEDYLGLIRLAMLFGLLAAVTYGFVRARGEEAGMYLLVIAIFYGTMFVPRVTVTIEDVNGGTGSPVTVDHVPVGLAFFASATSSVGHWLTEVTETMFALPDTSLNLSEHGLMGAARTMRLAQSAQVADPVLTQDLINFMRDCINPELIISPTTVKALLNATDIWTAFGPTDLDLINPGRMVALASGGTVNCSTAYTNLGTAVTSEAATPLGRLAQELSPWETPATAATILTAMLPASESLIMTASALTTDAIKQRMMINLLNDTSSNMAQIYDDPAAAQTALASAMAASSANSVYRTMAKLASETMPMIRNSVELVVLAVFPIMFVLILVAGAKGGSVLRTYIIILFWLQLWAPLYAVVNYVATMAGARNMKSVLGGIDGVAVSNAAALLNTTISAEAVAGMLSISVPIIALVLVKGGEMAMVGMTSGLLNPASSAASSAGAQAGVGNANMGNMSWGNGSFNNMAGNKSSMGWGYSAATRGDFSGEGGTATARGTMGGWGNLKADTGDAGVTGRHGAEFGASHRLDSGTVASTGNISEAGLSRGTSGSFTEAQRASAMAKLGKTMGWEVGGGWSYRDETTGGGGLSAGNQVFSGGTTGHRENVDMGGRAGLNANFGSADSARETLNSTLRAGGGKGPAQGSPQAVAEQIYQQSRSAGQAGASRADGGYGMGVRNEESKDFQAGQRANVSNEDYIRQGAAKVQNAVNQAKASTTNAGERAAMDDWLGNFARALEARSGVRVSSSLTNSAGESVSRTSQAGGSYAVSDNSLYGDAALGAAGGNPDAALRRLSTDGQFRDRVGRDVGGVVAGQADNSDMSGNRIEAPNSVDSERSSGMGLVDQQAGGFHGAAGQYGQDAKARAASMRGDIGAPPSTAMPDQDPGLRAYQQGRDAAGGGLSQAATNTGVKSGINRATEFMFDSRSGAARLMVATTGLNHFAGAFGYGSADSVDGFGTRTQTPGETQSILRNLASMDQPSANRLYSMGQRGEATQADVDFLNERAESLARQR